MPSPCDQFVWPKNPNLVCFPTLEAECNDTETRSLKKINDLLYNLTETELVTSQGFVSNYTLFYGKTKLVQLDFFSIAPIPRFIFILDAAQWDQRDHPHPYYIAGIYPNCSTSFEPTVAAPFQNGVTVVLSTSPNVITEDTGEHLLVTGIKRK